MDVVLLASRMTLAVVLLIAAVAKALDRSGTRDSLERFGVPAALVPAARVGPTFHLPHPRLVGGWIHWRLALG